MDDVDDLEGFPDDGTAAETDFDDSGSCDNTTLGILLEPSVMVDVYVMNESVLDFRLANKADNGGKEGTPTVIGRIAITSLCCRRRNVGDGGLLFLSNKSNGVDVNITGLIFSSTFFSESGVRLFGLLISTLRKQSLTEDISSVHCSL